MTKLTKQVCLAMAGLLMVSMLAGLANANTRSDFTDGANGGVDDWCPDTAQDTNFLLPGDQVDTSSDYCDDNEVDTAATVIGTNNAAVTCVDNPAGTGSGADTRCVGGATAIADGVFNRGELGDDYPQAIGVSFDITAGPGMQVNFRACTTILANDAVGTCYDDFDSAPLGTCMLAADPVVDILAAVNADAGADIPATEFVDQVYMFWNNLPMDPLNPADYTACGNTNPGTRSVFFDWTYAHGAGALASGTTAAITTALTLPPSGDGLTCLGDFEASGTWVTNGGGGGAWLLWESQQFVGYAVEATGAAQTVTATDIGVVPDGMNAQVVAYAYEVGDEGDLLVGPLVTCEAGAPSTPFECSDNIDNDGDFGVDYGSGAGNDAQCASPIHNEDGSLPTGFECFDGIDNDGVGGTDLNDVNCQANPFGTEAGASNGLPFECFDGIDNDGVGGIDMMDADCQNNPFGLEDGSQSIDQSVLGLVGTLVDFVVDLVLGIVEILTGSLPACANTLDDDGDFQADYPFDPECDSPLDGSEAI